MSTRITDTMPFDITQEQAVEAGKVCGALIFGYLWQLQHDFSGPTPLPFTAKKSGTKRYLSAKEAAEVLDVRKSLFFKLKREDKANFPKVRITASGKKYLATDVERYNKLLKAKKA